MGRTRTPVESVRRDPEADADRGLDAIVGIVEDGEPTDVARDGREVLREAREKRSRRKLGHALDVLR